jgi:uncharacterized protein YecE (DUF72 family)
VFTDSDEHPSFADPCAPFVYARLMRSQAGEPEGYPEAELRQWAERIGEWARGGAPSDLPYLDPEPPPPAATRDVFVFFISAAKERNPAAAMALLRLLGTLPA